MIYLFYFNKLSLEQQRITLLIAAIFGVAESLIVVFALNQFIVAYVPFPDLTLYAVVLLETLLISFIPDSYPGWRRFAFQPVRYLLAWTLSYS
jgi:hypothetical protein